MSKTKLMLLVTIVILAVLTAAGCTSGDKPGTSENLKPNDVVRTDNQKAVTVKATLVNPITEVGPALTFELNLDTHSVDLSAYDILANVSISTESGISLTGDNLLWEGMSEDFHHRSGLLITSQEQIKLGTDLGKLTLELYDLGGVPVRQFVWEQELLFNK
jgi:hypothetical protein